MDAKQDGKRIEWTGAGGDYLLAVVIDQRGNVIDECWGTLKEVREWKRSKWAHIAAQYIPMAIGAPRRKPIRQTTGKASTRVL